MLQTHPSELHNILIVFLTEKAGGLITIAGDRRCLQKNSMSPLPIAFWHI